MTAPVQAESSLLARTRAARSADACMALYDDWAATYNDDLAPESQDYVAPLTVAQIALRSKTIATDSIMDAGCGTGLVGEALARGGAKTIDGIDLSPPMLEEARRTGAYRDLMVGDLTRHIERPREMYDIVTCVGTFTHGHVGPNPALREFVRLTKSGGIIIATILDEVWLPGGYEAEVKDLEADGLVSWISMELKDYVKGRGDKARFIVLEKTAPA